ncbi:MAG: IS66 family transposase [Acidimicrobiales bacterium]
MDDGSASIFCFTPLRVTVSELDQLRAAPSPAESSSGPACSAPPIPQGPCPVCPRLEQEFEPWRQAAYWKTQHRRALAREAQLKTEVERLQALLRLREQQLFGRKTETAAATAPAAPLATPADPSPRRPRGQQPGKPGPKRRDYSHLPAVVEDHQLAPDQCRCSRCGQPFDDFPGTEDSIILEIDVRAHRRVIRRRRSRPTCSCAAHPGIVTAPPPPRVIPKSLLGVSIWVSLLLDKYLFYRPTSRLLADWATHGLDLSLGTVTDGLKHLVPLFEPVYEALVRHSQTQTLWHADETRWLVFASIEGKVGYRWYLWVFHSAEVVVFVLAAGRSHDVPEEHFGPVEGRGILVVDRYKAYQAIDKVKSGRIVLAFCWAHVRRDFLRLAKSWPDQESWALDWVAEIGTLYHLNDERLKVRHDAAAFAVADRALRAAVTSLGERGQVQLREPVVHPACQKVLESLGDHWTGLTVFVEHPEVPMDNNTAERSERGPVVGRKNYYGSGSVWSGELAAMLFSLFQTLCLSGLNPRLWLTAYLSACAEAGGRAPAEVDRFLPWNLSPEKRREWGCDDAVPAADTS